MLDESGTPENKVELLFLLDKLLLASILWPLHQVTVASVWKPAKACLVIIII